MTEKPVVVPQPSGTARAVVIGVMAIFAVAVAAAWLGGGFSSGPSDRSGSIAAQIGDGAFCTATSFTLTNRLDGSKTRLYDCRTDSKGEICVTEQNGVVSDNTSEAKLLFASTLGASAPSCAE